MFDLLDDPASPHSAAAAVGPQGRTWVLSGRLNLLFAGTLSDAFTVRRSDLVNSSTGWAGR
jgi:hypothetical protein